MKKDFGVKPYLFPMPVLMIATYDKDGKVDVMNMAYGGICTGKSVALNINKARKTSANIKEKMAFTIGIADVSHMAEADFLGIVSGNDMEDKFEKSGLTAVKSDKVDAPIILEWPISLECKVAELQQTVFDGFRVLGEIVNSVVDEKVIGEDGEIDPDKLEAIAFDPFKHRYYTIGEQVGQAFDIGKKILS